MANPQVQLDITGYGSLTIELDEAKAPKCAANFLAYVNKGHYDGTIFHRVIDGFMIQGGGFEPGMTQKAVDKPINNEADNGLKNNKYTLAMARTKTRTLPPRSFLLTWQTTIFSISNRPPHPAGATLCLAKSWPAWTSWTKSAASKQAAKGFMTTCPCKTWCWLKPRHSKLPTRKRGRA